MATSQGIEIIPTVSAPHRDSGAFGLCASHALFVAVDVLVSSHFLEPSFG